MIYLIFESLHSRWKMNKQNKVPTLTLNEQKDSEKHKNLSKQKQVDNFLYLVKNSGCTHGSQPA